MEELLSLIRSLAEQPEESPEIPSEMQFHDQQQVEQESEKAQAYQAEMFVESPEPQPNMRQPVKPPEEAIRPRQPIQMSEVDRTQPYSVRPLTMGERDPTLPPEAMVFDPHRVAVAQATAQFNQRMREQSPQVETSQRFDVQQVNPATRVMHMVPEAFPIDAGHAFAIVDRDVDLPAVEVQAPELPPFSSPAEAVSTEQLVAASYMQNDSLEEVQDRRVWR